MKNKKARQHAAIQAIRAGRGPSPDGGDFGLGEILPDGHLQLVRTGRDEARPGFSRAAAMRLLPLWAAAFPPGSVFFAQRANYASLATAPQWDRYGDPVLVRWDGNEWIVAE